MLRSKLFRGFLTLLVLLFIMVVSFPIHIGCGHDAFEVKAKSDVSNLGRIIGIYKKDHGQYPAELSQLIGSYLKKIPSDPWGNSYEYISSGEVAIIFTYGERDSKELIYHVEPKKI